jgi:hypothetical protein
MSKSKRKSQTYKAAKQEVIIKSAESEKLERGDMTTPEEFAAQAMSFHRDFVGHGHKALIAAWNAGDRLNKAYARVKYGHWGAFLRDNCAEMMGDSGNSKTVWNYRRIATTFPNLGELKSSGMTLNEVYQTWKRLDLDDEDMRTVEDKEKEEQAKKQRDEKLKQRQAKKGEDRFEQVVELLRQPDDVVTGEALSKIGERWGVIVANLIPLNLSDPEGWWDYIDTLPWEKGEFDNSSYHAFLRANSLGIQAEEAISEVAQRCRAAGCRPPASKLTHQFNRAAKYTQSSTTTGAILLPKVLAPEFDYGKLKRIAQKVSDIDENWLVSKSPTPLRFNKADTFLDNLYQQGEKVIVFTKYQSQGQVVYEVGKSSISDLPGGGPDGIWFLTNPVDGIEHLNEDQKMSRRSKEAITAWRYLVLECDHEDKFPGVNSLWLSALVQLPLKIAAIYTSGGKSVHALVRLDASSKEEWDAKRDKIKPILVPIGADPSAMTAVRLSRLPQTLRGRMPQRLLYLNPQPDGTPIHRRDP